MAKDKQIQISEKLFVEICQYFLLNQRSAEFEEVITKDINFKLDRIVEHELYTKSINTSIPEAEREAARKEYLDKRGIPDAFRWDTKYQNKRLRNG